MSHKRCNSDARTEDSVARKQPLVAAEPVAPTLDALPLELLANICSRLCLHDTTALRGSCATLRAQCQAVLVGDAGVDVLSRIFTRTLLEQPRRHQTAAGHRYCVPEEKDKFVSLDEHVALHLRAVPHERALAVVDRLSPRAALCLWEATNLFDASIAHDAALLRRALASMAHSDEIGAEQRTALLYGEPDDTALFRPQRVALFAEASRALRLPGVCFSTVDALYDGANSADWSRCCCTTEDDQRLDQLASAYADALRVLFAQPHVSRQAWETDADALKRVVEESTLSLLVLLSTVDWTHSANRIWYRSVYQMVDHGTFPMRWSNPGRYADLSHHELSMAAGAVLYRVFNPPADITDLQSRDAPYALQRRVRALMAKLYNIQPAIGSTAPATT